MRPQSSFPRSSISSGLPFPTTERHALVSFVRRNLGSRERLSALSDPTGDRLAPTSAANSSPTTLRPPSRLPRMRAAAHARMVAVLEVRDAMDVVAPLRRPRALWSVLAPRLPPGTGPGGRAALGGG